MGSDSASVGRGEEPASRGDKQASLCDDHPVYLAQRAKLAERRNTFRGKKSAIEDQYDKHHQSVEPREDSKIKKTWIGDALAQNDQIIIIGNWASFDVLQYQDKPARAGMSMIHLLAYPKEPIPNGVDLDESNVGIIDDMIELFRTTWANSKTRAEILQHQLDAIKRRIEKLPDEKNGAPKNGKDPALYEFDFKQANDAALAHFEELKSKVESGDLQFEDFEYGLHLRPENSADYLHLHIIAAPYEYRKYSTSEHDAKTKDAREVRDVILETPARIAKRSQIVSGTESKRDFRTEVEPSR